MNKKIAVIIIVILALGAVAWFGLQNSKAPRGTLGESATQSSAADTTTWKTYQNQEFGITLKYPPYLGLDTRTIVDPLDVPATGIKMRVAFIQSPEEPPGSFFVYLYPNPQELSIEKFRRDVLFAYDYDDVIVTPATISGFTGLQYKTADGQRVTTFVNVGSDVLEIDWGDFLGNEGPSFKTYQAIIENIIINSTSGWKTYRNEQHGFEFKYRPDFVVGDLISPGAVFENPDLLSAVSVEGPTGVPGIITVSVFKNSQNFSLADWIEKERLGFYRNDTETFDIDVCNTRGLRYGSFTGGKLGRYFLRGNNIYALEYHSYSPEEKVDENLFMFNTLASSYKCF